ncbi:MAG TPA: YdeI/OmpD-associated family protein [Gemmatimonadales bacterium]|nr:YdeI/OmpD-associated family protein [Gemmatimonadales bacterium]
MKIVFFKTPAAMRIWFQRHHTEQRILHVGFRKRHTGQPSITWPEAVDEALCFGWIDGVRHRIDADAYTIRFTHRRPGSIWSTVNLRRMRALIRAKRVRPHGLKVFAERNRKKTRLYAYEQQQEWSFSPGQARQFRANRRAWKWFQAQAPWYRRTCTHWVLRAKQEATRLRRLATLIDCSAAGRPIGPLDRTKYARR